MDKWARPDDLNCPDYGDPTAPAPTRNPNYDTFAQPEKWRRFVEITHGQIAELMTGYGPIDMLWLDAGQVRPPQQDLQMDRLAAMARQHQPRLIIVDRTVGGRFENYRTPEQGVPERPPPYAWETCMTMGDQWSFKPNDQYTSAHRLDHVLVDLAGKRGNFLLNVRPQPDGQMPAAFGHRPSRDPVLAGCRRGLGRRMRGYRGWALEPLHRDPLPARRSALRRRAG